MVINIHVRLYYTDDILWATEGVLGEISYKK